MLSGYEFYSGEHRERGEHRLFMRVTGVPSHYYAGGTEGTESRFVPSVPSVLWHEGTAVSLCSCGCSPCSPCSLTKTRGGAVKREKRGGKPKAGGGHE